MGWGLCFAFIGGTSEKPCPRLRREQGTLKTYSLSKGLPPAH